MARPLKLTQRIVEAAACRAGRKDMLLFDGEVSGFGLRVTAAGSKIFLAQYTGNTGRRRVVLGVFGVLTVDEARRKARAILGAAASGRDPYAENKAAAETARLAKAEAALTFGKLVDSWVIARAGDRRPSYLREAKACLARNLLGWCDRPASSITLRESICELDKLKAEKGFVAANRTLAYARAAYGWAVKRQLLAANPLKGIERLGRETARQRVLNRAELHSIWKACGCLPSTVGGGFVRMLMLTLQRRHEVAAMRWVELDDPINPATWTIPSERAKNGRAHIVHLAEPARQIVRSMPNLNGNPFVFSGKSKKEMAAFSSIKSEIDAALATAGENINDWRFHDFRRAGVTALADMAFPPHVCDSLLKGATGSVQGVAAVYQRAEFLSERKAALDAWSVFVSTGATQQSAPKNVVLPVRTADMGNQTRFLGSSVELKSAISGSSSTDAQLGINPKGSSLSTFVSIISGADVADAQVVANLKVLVALIAAIRKLDADRLTRSEMRAKLKRVEGLARELHTILFRGPSQRSSAESRMRMEAIQRSFSQAFSTWSNVRTARRRPSPPALEEVERLSERECRSTRRHLVLL